MKPKYKKDRVIKALIINAILGCVAYLWLIHSIAAAAVIFWALLWLSLVIGIGAVLMPVLRDYMRTLGRNIPPWLSHGIGAAFIFAFASVSMWNVVCMLIIIELLEAHVFWPKKNKV